MNVQLEHFAAALAEWCNGGSWGVDYTDNQKSLWRDRAEAIRKHPTEIDLIGSADARL